MARMTLRDAKLRDSTIDRAKLDATTEEDIERIKAEDGFAGIEPPDVVTTVPSLRQLRVGLGMTQQEIADALRIPLGTWRNWEQHRVQLDPAARSLLRVVAANPSAAFEALSAAEKESA